MARRASTLPEHLVPETRWYTFAEVAERYRVPVETIKSWRYQGRGPVGTKFGHRVLYGESDLARFEAEQRQAS